MHLFSLLHMRKVLLHFLCLALAGNLLTGGTLALAQPKLLMDLQSQQSLISEDIDSPFTLTSLNAALDMMVSIQAMKSQNKTFSACVSNTKNMPSLGQRLRQFWFSPKHDINPVLTCLNMTAIDLTKAKEELLTTLQLHHTDLEKSSTTITDLITLTRYLDEELADFFQISQNSNHSSDKTLSTINSPYSLINQNTTSIGILNSSSAAWMVFENLKHHQNRRLLVIVGQATSQLALENEVKRLYQTGYQQYDTFEVYAPGASVIRNRLYLGTQKYLNLVVREPVWVTVESEELNRWGRDVLELKVTKLTPLLAPISDDTPLGELNISLQTKQGLQFLKSLPLYPEHEVPLGDRWHQFIDTLRLVLKARNE